MPDHDDWQPIEGGCACKKLRYRMEKKPLVVHCCYCTWCQRESGSAFCLNAMIESKYITPLTDLKPLMIPTPSESGEGQMTARCPSCHFMVWSNYGDAGDYMRAVRVGTLDDPSRTPPDVHIYTSTKSPWILIPEGVPVREEYYERSEIWSEASLKRREELIASVSR